MSSTVFLAAVVLVAIIVESAAGFGATVVTVTLGAQLLPLDTVLAAFLPLNVMLSAVVVARNVKFVDRRVLLVQILPWMGIGTAVGVALARYRGAGWIKIVFAAFVIVLSISELVGMKRKTESAEKPLSRPVSVVALSTAGIIHGLFACGGPLVVWVVGRSISEKSAFRATLSALWLMMNVVLVGTMVWDGSVSRTSMFTTAALVPSLLLGLFLGDRLHRRLDERSFRLAVFVLLLVAATVLLLRSIW